MLSAADFDRRRMNPMVYIKFWRQACIPALLFGAELWPVTKSGLEKLERCQRWFLKKHFHLPDFVDSLLLNVISGLPTAGSLLHQTKAIFSGQNPYFAKRSQRCARYSQAESKHAECGQ